ncbi:meiosis protein SPO22/ZIP4 like-domain-containing protein [Lophiotrema nucula]|uniref:Protein ZIP4 homolog n=1 Tax=Lophiotrema nucula TaxID=690887 RepID=A0A6A5Z7B6_9PLEO|nr:meiosis protein SPO22/ZIP4 like-domain-containing protein [Lophiotrema nucula]
MAPANTASRNEREKKLKSLLFFASNLEARLTATARDTSLLEELQVHIRTLPLAPSSTVAAKQDDLDRIGTELWNLSTRLRRDEQPDGKPKDEVRRKKKALSSLRVFSFLLLDSAAGQVEKGRERKNCVRLMKVALKAARVCIDSNEYNGATKVLERAADYQEALVAEPDKERNEEAALRERLRVEYFALRTTLAWRQDRMDTAEHMYAKSRQAANAPNSSTAECLADLFYEMGKDFFGKRNYELAVRWLERAHDVLLEQAFEESSSETSELRLSIMQCIVQAYMKLKTDESQKKANDLVSLMETEHGEKIVVCLLRLELLSASDDLDINRYYAVLLRMIRSVVLTETNFKTIMHHIHKLKDHSNSTVSRLLEDLLDIRLFEDGNEDWIEKVVITRIWIGTTSSLMDNTLASLQGLVNKVSSSIRGTLSAPATHAAQTLLWKRVEVYYSQADYGDAEAWCRLCLHALFERAGELNKGKIARKVILCAISRQDYAAARDVFSKMSDVGKNEPITRFLMYKMALHSNDFDFAAECLDEVCRKSSKDATLLYACVVEAQNGGDRRQSIAALKKVLDKYDYAAPAGIHLPALLRCTTRMLSLELIKDDHLDTETVEELCKVFDGASAQAKASRRRPSTPAQQLFTVSEFEWFSKNAYNIALKYCAEMQPAQLIRLLRTCIELQYYLETRKHCEAFRRNAIEQLDGAKLGESAQKDITSKHFQVIKLELEATMRLEEWDRLDGLFDEALRYKEPGNCESLADLVLVIHTQVVKANVDGKRQQKILTVLQKIINITWQHSNNDIVKLSRWIRCLFQLALSFDESISLKCIDQASLIAAARHGVSDDLEPITQQHLLNTPPPSSSPTKVADAEGKETNCYPSTELEWLATTCFNLAVDYYLQENDEKCRAWADKAVNVAQWMEDNGQLRNQLTEKRAGLISWE